MIEAKSSWLRKGCFFGVAILIVITGLFGIDQNVHSATLTPITTGSVDTLQLTLSTTMTLTSTGTLELRQSPTAMPTPTVDMATATLWTKTPTPTLNSTDLAGTEIFTTQQAQLTATANCVKGDGRIVTTESGLQYEDLIICEGTEAAAGKTITVHYLGELSNGLKVDSSFDRDEPFNFVLGSGQVIPGWEEGIKGMRVGSQRRLIIPPALAYGAAGSPPIVPPNATLIFTVMVIAVK